MKSTYAPLVSSISCHSSPSNSTQTGVNNLQILKGSLFSPHSHLRVCSSSAWMPFLLFFPKPITRICPSKARTVALPAKTTCLQFTHLPVCYALNVSPKSSYFVGQPNNQILMCMLFGGKLGRGTSSG